MTVYVAQPHNNSNYAQVFSTFEKAIEYVTIRTRRSPDSQTIDFANWYYWDIRSASYSGECSWIVLKRVVDLEIM